MVAGERPADLTQQEAVAYDLAAALNDVASSAEGIFKAAKDILGERGVAEIVFLAGCFWTVSVVLNVHGVAVPGPDA